MRLFCYINGVVAAAVVLALAGCCRRADPAAPAAPGAATNAAAAVEEAVWSEPMEPLPDAAEAETNRLAWIRLQMRENARQMGALTAQKSKLEEELRGGDPELKRLYDESVQLRAKYDQRLREQELMRSVQAKLNQLAMRQNRLVEMRLRLEQENAE